MTDKNKSSISWFVQSYYKECAATAILSEPIINHNENSMTLCKVLLYGLKPSDINYSVDDKILEIPCGKQQEQQQQPEQEQQQSLSISSPMHPVETKSASEANYLSLHIKPLTTPTYARSLFGSGAGHESSPLRVIIRETPSGRHRICVSQTLLRTHNSDI